MAKTFVELSRGEIARETINFFFDPGLKKWLEPEPAIVSGTKTKELSCLSNHPATDREKAGKVEPIACLTAKPSFGPLLLKDAQYGHCHVGLTATDVQFRKKTAAIEDRLVPVASLTEVERALQQVCGRTEIISQVCQLAQRIKRITLEHAVACFLRCPEQLHSEHLGFFEPFLFAARNHQRIVRQRQEVLPIVRLLEEAEAPPGECLSLDRVLGNCLAG